MALPGKSTCRQRSIASADYSAINQCRVLLELVIHGSSAGDGVTPIDLSSQHWEVPGHGLLPGAIQGPVHRTHHPRRLAEAEGLHTAAGLRGAVQTLEDINVTTPELTNPLMVRLLVDRQRPKSQALFAGLLNQARGDKQRL